MFKYALLTLVLFTTTANAEKEFATLTQQREWLAAAYALRCYRATELFVSNPAFSKEEIASVCTCSAAKLVDSYSENDLKDFADNGTWKQFPPEL
jgi:hypothetical protein